MAALLDRLYMLDEGFFQFNLKYLFFVGLWPGDELSEKRRILYKIYEYTFHAATILLFIVTGIGIYEHKNNLTLLLTNLDKTFLSYNFFLKTVVFIIRRDTLRRLIEDIEESDDVISDERKKLMVKAIVTISVSCLLVVTSFSLLAVYKGEMTIEAWMPFDPLESRLNLILSAQLLAVIFLPGFFRAFAMQGIVCSLIVYIRDQLIDLQNTIMNLHYTEETGEESRQKLKEAIKKHVRLMRYSKTLEIVFKEYFLIQNLAITVELCLNALMVIVVSNITLLLTFMAYLCLGILNAYIYSYLGNELILQSTGIVMAAYKSPWTSWPVDMQKDLLLLITAAQRPLALSAGGMSLLSINTFSRVLSNGYSVFAVLNDMVD